MKKDKAQGLRDRLDRRAADPSFNPEIVAHEASFFVDLLDAWLALEMWVGAGGAGNAEAGEPMSGFPAVPLPGQCIGGHIWTFAGQREGGEPRDGERCDCGLTGWKRG